MKLKNRNPKMVEILNTEYIGFKCRVCGQIWHKSPLTKRFNWKCPNGCTLEDLESKEREHYREVIKSEN